MKCLIVTANPSATGYSYALVNKFIEGIESAGHTYEMVELFQGGYMEGKITDLEIQEKIKAADGICLAFPWWCEMPPFPLVAFMQQNLKEGFAFTRDADGNKVPLLNKKVQLLISMGSAGPEYFIRHVIDGLKYAGLKVVNNIVVQNVGPNLPKEKANFYLEQAHHQGTRFLTFTQ
jgi:putative NADPH-quinone reductase